MRKITMLAMIAATAILTGCLSTVPTVTTNPATGLPQTNVSYVLPSALTNAPVIAGQAAEFLPPPYNTIVAGAATLALAIMTGILNSKNKQLAASNAVNNSVVSAATTTGVPADLAAAITAAAIARGVSDHPAITAINSNTPA